MQELCSGGTTLRVYLERVVDSTTSSGTAIYSGFIIGDSSTDYTLTAANYLGYEGENGNIY